MRARLLGLAALAALAFPAVASARNDFHPEHEWQLVDWVPIHLGPLDMSINKAVAYLWLGGLLTIVLGIVLMRVRLRHDPTRRQTTGEMVYDIVQTQIAEQGLPAKAVGTWFPYVASLFLFILTMNLVGFLPLPISNEKFHLFGAEIPTWGIYAVTSQLSVTLTLALLSVIFTHVEGIRFNGIRYFKSFVPPGLPPLSVTTAIPLALMALLETISHVFRIISLSVRLYANMLAGHMLILIFIGLIFIAGNAITAIAFIPVATGAYIFEVGLIAAIQAYIFAALTAIYIGSAIEPAH